jgi:hypothetical protein
MAKRILCLVPNPNDALSFYRAMGPLSRMTKDYRGEFTFEYATDFNWSKIRQFDAVFVQRPFRHPHLQVIKIAKDWGIPVVIDYDDWLFDLKTDNPAWKTYSRNDEVKRTINETFKLCDHMFVATEHLKKLYTEKGVQNITVVPNAYDRNLFSYVKPQERRKIVLWRGSDTHVHDCMTVREGYEELMKKHKDWTFIFMHQYPWFFSKPFENMCYVDGLETIDYFKKIYEMSPAIMCHPLSDCDFNRAKSMACFLEAAHAGAAFVGPDFEEFNRPGITNYKPESSEDFFNKMDFIITHPQTIAVNHAQAWKYIMGNLELAHTNKLRAEVFRAL